MTDALVYAATDGHHEPASHPVRRRKAMRERLDAHPLPPVSAVASHQITESIDYIAEVVQRIPDVPLTVLQRRSLTIIARELIRRARPPNERS